MEKARGGYNHRHLSIERAARQPSVHQEVRLTNEQEEFKREHLIVPLQPNHSWGGISVQRYIHDVSEALHSCLVDFCLN